MSLDASASAGRWSSISSRKAGFAQLFVPARNDAVLAAIQADVDAYWSAVG